MTKTETKNRILDEEVSENGQPEPLSPPTPLTEDDRKNITALIEAGAKVMSHDKPLDQSVQIQTVALQLIKKINGNANT